MRISPANPVAKAISRSRRQTATRVVKPKKGKGSYNRNKEKNHDGRTATSIRVYGRHEHG